MERERKLCTKIIWLILQIKKFLGRNLFKKSIEEAGKRISSTLNDALTAHEAFCREGWGVQVYTAKWEVNRGEGEAEEKGEGELASGWLPHLTLVSSPWQLEMWGSVGRCVTYVSGGRSQKFPRRSILGYFYFPIAGGGWGGAVHGEGEPTGRPVGSLFDSTLLNTASAALQNPCLRLQRGSTGLCPVMVARDAKILGTHFQTADFNSRVIHLWRFLLRKHMTKNIKNYHQALGWMNR